MSNVRTTRENLINTNGCDLEKAGLRRQFKKSQWRVPKSAYQPICVVDESAWTEKKWGACLNLSIKLLSCLHIVNCIAEWLPLNEIYTQIVPKIKLFAHCKFHCLNLFWNIQADRDQMYYTRQCVLNSPPVALHVLNLKIAHLRSFKWSLLKKY